ncbi:alpha/beta fold hydrolase [Actinomycetospora sp. TBRC 11914]|uniref:alpha/beta fold hydrolase n=1 Tax=Actinomycetospora sp. TBRC 11914 TaxID=2729387 RepID=UPI00145D4B4B|nr:alpha/beta hydrolase [Actinomycetospora sp. TBRC 11914]NMO90249.1 alpha/beta hydrolase [Actinomycetospora sp. TBRC 11914]
MTSVEDVAVPGARLHTEVRGSGPLLVCVVGGNGDPTVFGPLADLLAPRWTVLTYVRRGFVRSPVDGEVGPDKLGDDVEDLARLIERHGGPAVVLGSSSGAIVTLELLVRRPDLVRVAVAHEPPLVGLLEDGDALVARFDAVLATYRREGAQAAMAEFGELTGVVGARRPPAGEEPAAVPPEFVAMRERWPANNAFWFSHEYGPYPVHPLDVAALREHADRLVLAVGAQSRAEAQLASRPNLVLADELGLTPLEVPGGHLGYLEDPAGFAAALDGAVRLLAWES